MKKILTLFVCLVMVGCSNGTMQHKGTEKHNEFLTLNTDAYTTESSWLFDVTDVDQLIDHAVSVVKVKVVSVDDFATFDYGGMPKTGVNVEIIDTLKGDHNEISRVYFPGGKYTAEDLMKANLDSVQKAGYDKLSVTERKETIVTMIPDGHVDLVEGATYIMVLTHTDQAVKDGVFVLGASGYSLFRLGADGETYLNDITKTTHKITEFN